MSASINGSQVGGGSASLPASPAQALLDAANPFELVVLGAGGVGGSSPVGDIAAPLVAPTLALRRTAAAATTGLLWECTETVSPLASTGSVACNLADDGAATFNYMPPASTLDGGALRCTGSLTSEVLGGAGVYPAGPTTTAVTLWVIFTANSFPSGGSSLIFRDYRAVGSPWADPYGTGVMLRSGGQLVVAGAFGPSPAYVEVTSTLGTLVTNRQYLAGMTYDGTLLRMWLDGVQINQTTPAAPLTWGAAGSWHLGGSGGNGGGEGGNPLDGAIMRAGVENTVWSQTDWARAYRRLNGNTSDL